MTKVMLVEDDPTMLSLLQTLLEIEGFEVAKPADFNNVVAEVVAHKPDVMLVDVHLQDASGFDILEAVREEEAVKHTAVIMSSGMDFSSECIQKGANDFVMKPYMPDELIEKIKKLVH
jgi:two-component system, OmpR family, alkaline phosphatase synthesis response regulator PhoP